MKNRFHWMLLALLGGLLLPASSSAQQTLQEISFRYNNFYLIRPKLPAEELEKKGWTDIDSLTNIQYGDTTIYTHTVLRHDLSPYALDNGEIVYRIVDTMPAYPGGWQAIKNFTHLKTQLQQDAAKRNQKPAMVFVQAVVNEDGALDHIQLPPLTDHNPEAKPDIAPYFDAALAAVRQLPAWTPGRHRGQPVKCEVIIRVDFGF